jgi:hypothetical protein
VDAYPVLLYGCISYLSDPILACQLSSTETYIQIPFLLTEALNIYSSCPGGDNHPVYWTVYAVDKPTGAILV